jgi:IPT/TIG domain
VMGTYENDPSGNAVFASQETNGTWGAAVQVAIGGSTAPGSYNITGLSCPMAGDCEATGNDVGGSGYSPIDFVVASTNGVWAATKAIPGLSALDAGPSQNRTILSCSAVGNCVVAGEFLTGGSGTFDPPTVAFLDQEVNGTWATAHVVPGLSNLDVYDDSFVTSLSCSSPGNCEAGGSYATDVNVPTIDAWTSQEKGGVWHNAGQLPSDPNPRDPYVDLESISCAGTGSCVGVGGILPDASTNVPVQPFYATESDGIWRQATPITDAFGSTYGAFTTVSCSSTTSCGAAGIVNAAGGVSTPFVLNEINGNWSHQSLIGGFTSSTQTNALGAIACFGPDECALDGNIGFGSEGTRPFVTEVSGGSWAPATSTPFDLASTVGGSMYALSCSAAGACVGVGLLSPSDGQDDEVISYAQPSISMVTPRAGLPSGGAAITIDGTLLNGAGLTVLFGSKPAASVMVVNADELRVVAPAGTGTVTLHVSDAFGPAFGHASITFTYEHKPTITKLSPTSGAVKGGTKVTVTGTNLGAVSEVLFGSVPATSVTSTNGSHLVVVSPPGKGKVSIRVVTPLGETAKGGKSNFTYKG